MSKVGHSGATRIRETNGRLSKFPKKHLVLVTGVCLAILTMTALVPSPEVEARKNSIEIQIDEPVTETAKTDLLSITEPAKTVISPTKAPTKPKETKEQRLARKEAERIAQENARPGRWQSVSVQSGDNLSNLFSAQGLSARVVYEICKTSEYGKTLTDIRPGQILEFKINGNNELTRFRYIQDRLNSILYQKSDKGYTAERITLKPEVRIAFAEGSIKNSLSLASQSAGLTDRITMELAGIFGWDIDFALDIRKGDSFNLIYEEHFLDGEKLGNGKILAATFTNRGNTYTAIRYTDSNGNTSYYSPDGRSMRKAFLRTPVEFTRISSRFNPNRLHPVFKTKRPHRGVDYAAPTGTPIKAAGDGRIKFAGKQNGYGYVTYIEHPNNIVTVYAHQSRLNKRFKKGSRVRQGDIIGYVGQTGWATGPHLHYEFRVNGTHRDPVTVKLPDATPIPKAEMTRFTKHSKSVLATLQQYQKTILAVQ